MVLKLVASSRSETPERRESEPSLTGGRSGGSSGPPGTRGAIGEGPPTRRAPGGRGYLPAPAVHHRPRWSEGEAGCHDPRELPKASPAAWRRRRAKPGTAEENECSCVRIRPP